MSDRRTLLRWAVAGATPSVWASTAQSTPTRAPEIDLFTGGSWRLTYLDFWASWCGPCRDSFPWMNQMHDRFESAGLRIVAVNLDRKEDDARQFLQQRPARFQLVMDPRAELARQFEISAMPTSMLIAPDRAILFTHRGFRAQDAGHLERQISTRLGAP